MDDVVIAIRQQLLTKRTDMGWAPHATLHPADPAEIAKDEERLGFALPPLMKRLYVEVANGGFGPGYGLTGLTGGVPDDTGKTAAEIYAQLRDVNPDEPTWLWPHALLPVCHWGCAILSCVDCSDARFRMRIFDPNVHEGDDWADSFFEESKSFEVWMEEWAAGTDLWEAMYGEAGHVAKALSARRPIR